MTGEKSVYLKVIAVGYGFAGKTSMYITYVTKEFPGQHLPTVFNSNDIKINEHTKVDLYDTGGGENYDRIRPLVAYLLTVTEAFFLCFDVSNRHLFKNLKKYWYSELRHHCPDVPIILTATKIDLRETEENCVTTEEGEALAAKTHSHYAEISSLKGIGLNELFEKVIAIAHEYNSSDKKENPNNNLKVNKCDLL